MNSLKGKKSGIVSQNEILDGVRYSAVALQPCPSGHITADKRLRCASPKLPSATSFIRKTLYEIAFRPLKALKQKRR